jgi:hypothetical protein
MTAATPVIGRTMNRVGGWSDLTPVSQAARESLAKRQNRHSQSGLRPQGAGLFGGAGATKWLFFWLIGRVEWAWAAAPIIASSARSASSALAQLNIGFVRSRTEVAVLETRPTIRAAISPAYTRLYTSLTTGYDLSFDDPLRCRFRLSQCQLRAAADGVQPSTLNSARTRTSFVWRDGELQLHWGVHSSTWFRWENIANNRESITLTGDADKSPERPQRHPIRCTTSECFARWTAHPGCLCGEIQPAQPSP